MSILLLSVLTIVGAYGISVALALALLFFTYATVPHWVSRSGEPRRFFLLLNIAIWCLASAMGGMVAGYLAQWHPNIITFGLACALFAAILSTALDSIGKTTLNYEVLVAAGAAASAVGGGLLVQFFHLHMHI